MHNKQQATSNKQVRLKALALGFLAALAIDGTAYAGEPTTKVDTLRSVMALYGLNEEQAIARMAREAEAAETWMRIRDAGLVGYAGAWFDGERLRVATRDAADHQRIEALDAVPVAVEQSLEQLESIRSTATERLAAAGLISSHIDYAGNRVVLGYDEAAGESGRESLAQGLRQHGFDPARFELKPARHAVPSSGPVRGGDGTRNKTWEMLKDTQNAKYRAFPCSVGVAIEGGYATAGHCIHEGSEMAIATTPYQTYSSSNCAANQPTLYAEPQVTDYLTLGSGQETLFFDPSPTKDSGWVATDSGWTPQAQINGYNDGMLSVPSLWAGLLIAPINTTVCRYGQSSEGPHCGAVSAFNVTRYYGATAIVGLTEVAGSCTVDSDSGGPWVSVAGQVQGTNYGGACPHECPADPENPLPTWFQPITDTLDAFGKTMLTSHGTNAPTAIASCPMIGGPGYFTCRLDSWQSQGKVDLTWSKGTATGHDLDFFATCTPYTNVTVQLAIQNGYGTTISNHQFICPHEAVIYP